MEIWNTFGNVLKMLFLVNYKNDILKIIFQGIKNIFDDICKK